LASKEKTSVKKILLLTYYFPPAGSIAVQRWAKFCKYLPSFGYDVLAYKPKNPHYATLDESFLADVQNVQVLELPIFEPYQFYEKLTKQKSNSIGDIASKPKNWQSKLAQFVRSIFFIPDAKCFWIRPSVRFLKKYLHENPVDIIISTGPPHSMHRIAFQLKKYTNTTWIADFRDPWVDLDYLDSMPLSFWTKWWQKRMEKEVLQSADAILTVSQTWQKDLQAKTTNPVYFLPNGYDDADFADVIPLPKSKDECWIVHTGSLTSYRNPKVFYDILQDLPAQWLAKIKVFMIGQSDEEAKNALNDFPLLQDKVVFIAQMPHQEALRYQKTADVLLLLLNQYEKSKGLLTAKVYEYLAMQKPIFALGDPAGEVGKLLENTQAGKISSYHAPALESASVLLDLLRTGQTKNVDTSAYTRKRLTEDLVGIMKL